MAPSSKRIKIGTKSSIIASPSSVSSGTKSPKPRRKSVEKSKNCRKNAATNGEQEQKTPRTIPDDDARIFDLFSGLKSTKKSSTKRPRRRKSPKTSRSSSPVDLDELLKDGAPETPRNDNKSFIDSVFDKWMEIDPYASIARYLPGEAPTSPDKPLTLFSPVKDVVRTFSTPQVRSKTRRAIGSPSGEEMGKLDRNKNESWSLSTLGDARKEMQLGATPLFRKCLDPSAYSPCNSAGRTLSRLNGSGWSCDNDDLPSCSTPLEFKTPSAPVNRSLAFTGEPLSGVKSLFNEKGSNGATNTPTLAGTTPMLPSRLLPQRLCSNTPRLGNYSLTGCNNVTNTPDGAKTTILFGITCYVEVRYNKEDRSEWVRNEVASHGAKVEKNFTKKVTHVIFKEGKISTYMKAQEANIPVVSLLWIEACKTVGGLVDPKLYAPSDNEQYMKNIPIEEARKRERFLRRGQAFLDRLNGILPPKPPRTRSNKKKNLVSATEGKRKRKVTNSETKQPIKTTQLSKGPKKLDFNNPGTSGSAVKKSTDSDSDYVSETDTEGTATKDQKRRRSAPADLGKGVQPKLTQFFTKKTKKNNEDLLRTPPKSSDQSPQKDLMKILTGGYVTTDKKRRKLFDPNESMSFSQNLPGTPAEMSPYIKASPSSVSTRSRSTSKRSKRVPAVERPSAARKSLAPLMEHEEHDSSLAQTSRNSLSCFVLEKKSKVPAKCQPRIAFTSISKEDLTNCKGIVKKLGMFDIDTTVTKRTTHLVTTAPGRRTINMVKAIARGCWILDLEWMTYSESNGKWMSEEPYELKSFSEAVTACRLEKQAFGKDFSLDLFSSRGHIFVDSDVQPPRPDLVEMLKLCGGKVVHVSVKADVVISLRPASEAIPEVSIVSPLWILDSITQNKSLPLDQYKV